MNLGPIKRRVDVREEPKPTPAPVERVPEKVPVPVGPGK